METDITHEVLTFKVVIIFKSLLAELAKHLQNCFCVN